MTGISLSILCILGIQTTGQVESILKSGNQISMQSNFSANPKAAVHTSSSASSVIAIGCVLNAGAVIWTIDFWVTLTDYVDCKDSHEPQQEDEIVSSRVNDGPANSGFCINPTKLIVAGAFIIEKYEALFSYESGTYYFEKQLFMEAIEISNQLYQLITFSYVRTKQWVIGLSIIIIMNGILVPFPHFVRTCASRRSKGFALAKMLTASIDVSFDLC